MKRRRNLRQAVMLTFVLLTTALSTACIFDSGDYKGGGRLGRSASASQNNGSSSSSGDDTTGDDDDSDAGVFGDI